MQNKFLNQIMNILAMKFAKNISELRVKFINASLETKSVRSELNPRSDSSALIVFLAPFRLKVHSAMLRKSHALLFPKGEHSRHSRTMLGSLR